MTTFEHLGWFEEFYIGSRFMGLRRCGDPAPRKTCHEGEWTKVLTEPVVLTRNLKTVTLKASPQNPVAVRTLVYPLCGKVV